MTRTMHLQTEIERKWDGTAVVGTGINRVFERFAVANEEEKATATLQNGARRDPHFHSRPERRVQ